MRDMITQAMDPRKFGARIKELIDRQRLSLAEASRRSGVADHVISRLVKGENEKPSFEDIIKIGMTVLDLTPNQMAALADVYPIEETESAVFDSATSDVLTSLRHLLYTAPPAEKRRLVNTLTAIIELSRHRINYVNADTDSQLPEWLVERFEPDSNNGV